MAISFKHHSIIEMMVIYPVLMWSFTTSCNGLLEYNMSSAHPCGNEAAPKIVKSNEFYVKSIQRAWTAG